MESKHIKGVKTRNIILNTRDNALKIRNGARGQELKTRADSLVTFYIETCAQLGKIQQLLNANDLTERERKILAILNDKES